MTIKHRRPCPALHYDRDLDCFMLYLPSYTEDNNSTYAMAIHSFYDGRRWYHYHFVRWDIHTGEWIEVVTNAQYQERLNFIRENEGELVAKVWAQEQDQVDIERDKHPVFRLAEHWEALVALDIISLPVSLNQWKGKALSQEALEKLDQVRCAEDEDRDRDIAEAMAEDRKRDVLNIRDQTGDDRILDADHE